MSAPGVAIRAVGVLTVAYSLALAWPPVAVIRAASELGGVMSAFAVADPAAREVFAQDGVSSQALADEVAGRYRKEALAEQAPALACSVLGVVAGVLLVLRRRAGASLLLAFVLWPLAAWGYHELREALRPVKLSSFALLSLPLARRVVRLELLGGTWELDGDAFWLAVQVTFTAVALGILAPEFLAERRERGRA